MSPPRAMDRAWFAFEAAAIPGSARHFIAAPFPVGFWRRPGFGEGLDARLALAHANARRRAAAAALDNAMAAGARLEAEVDEQLRPLDDQVERVAEALVVLEETGAAAAQEGTPARRGGARGDRGRDEGARVQIAKNDVALAYDANLSLDFLAMVYAARRPASGGVLFGTWYATLQATLVAERPQVSRAIDSRDGRMSRTFMGVTTTALQACGRLYVGNRHYSALESAALCLHLVHRARQGPGAAAAAAPLGIADLLERVPEYLDALSQALAEGGRISYRYNYARVPREQLHGRYALEGHSVLAALGPARGPRANVGERTVDGAGFVDEVNRAGAAFLAAARNLFLGEDAALLRATVNTITGLLLLRRLLHNGNVYGDRLRNNFQLGALVPNAAARARGASGDAPASRSGDGNLRFLLAHYVVVAYRADERTDVTQLFPGLAALCVDAHSIRARVHGHQLNLVRLVALELQNRQRVTAPVNEVIAAHDAVAVQYEEGLGLVLQQPHLRNAADKRLGQFGVSSDYDLLYFLCLGYIPQFAAA
uniref:PRV polypeptide n=1 Tax=Suid herpesvirus 1 TaxID=10345 RepID=Q85026_SUHV|nr:PRV polypeptide [Suid alphaherpesvirus 1]